MTNFAHNNHAFIDSQNLNLGVQSLGWKLDWHKFRVYLLEKYHVTTAYMFIGYIADNQSLYTSLQKAGYVLCFKPVLLDKGGKHKGNVDANLVLEAMIGFNNKTYDKAVIITSDGDFYCLVQYLYEQERLEKVISPYYETCSTLLKKSAREKIVFMPNLADKLAYKRKNTA